MICLTLSDSEIGLNFLQGSLYPNHYCLHNFYLAQHTPAVHGNWFNKGVVAKIEVKWTVSHSHIDNIVGRKFH